MACVKYVDLISYQYPDATLKSNLIKCLLLFFLIRIINKFGTNVDNKNKQNNIKLAIIKTNLPK